VRDRPGYDPFGCPGEVQAFLGLVERRLTFAGRRRQRTLEGDTMARKRTEEDRGTIKTDAATAGEPQTLDRSGLLMRAEESDMLSPEALDRRQKKLRKKRLWGGPKLDGRGRTRGEADESVPDDPPTDTEEPPGRSP
jgi:hypothetical protein